MLVDYSSSSEDEAAEPASKPAAAASAAVAQAKFALPAPSGALAKRRKALPLLEEAEVGNAPASSSSSDEEEDAPVQRGAAPRPQARDDDDDAAFMLKAAAPLLAEAAAQRAVALPELLRASEPAIALAPAASRKRRINEHEIRRAVQSGADVSAQLAQVGAVELAGDFVRADAARHNTAEDALKSTIHVAARGDGRNHIRSLVAKAEVARAKDELF